MAEAPIVEARNVEMAFDLDRVRGKRTRLKVLRDLSFDVGDGETLGSSENRAPASPPPGACSSAFTNRPAGRSSCSARLITGPERRANLAAVRSRTQFVFQDPTRRSIRACASAIPSPSRSTSPALTHAATAATAYGNCWRWWDCRATPSERFPHEFSGGQRQRIVIARALGAGAAGSSSATSPSPRSTSRCRRRSSIC